MAETGFREHDKQFKRVAIYSRKSKFTGKGESVENQVEMCKKYLEVHFVDDFASMQIEVFEDEGFSGKNTNRPKFQTMMKRIEKKEFDAVVCYRLDRISRSTKDFTDIIETLNKYGVDFISMRDKFDTSTPTGRAMMLMSSVFSQLERETIAERIQDNMRELAKTGRWLGGISPTGYKSKPLEKLTIDGKKKSSSMLEIVEKEIIVVKKIYSTFLETNSLSATNAYMLQSGIKSKRNNDFSRHTIKNILRNPVYMIADSDAREYFERFDVEIFADRERFDGVHGIMAYNKTAQKYGEANKLKDIADWIISVGAHEGLISGQDWIKVQAMLDNNKSKAYRKPRSHTALLSGLLRCANCGAFMRPKQTTRDNADGGKTYYYMCETKEESKRHLCNIKNMNGNELDALICEEIKKLSQDDSVFIKQLKKAKTLIQAGGSDYEVQIKGLEDKIAENEKMIQDSIPALIRAKGGASYDYINLEIERLHQENASYQERIEEIKCLVSDYDLPDSQFDILRDMVQSFGLTVDNMSVEEKRAAIRSVVRKVTWDGEEVHVYLFGSDDGRIDYQSDFSTPAESEEVFPLGGNSK